MSERLHQLTFKTRGLLLPGSYLNPALVKGDKGGFLNEEMNTW
jgi:hypothetical protein